MKIPHKSKQKEGWLYWEFGNNFGGFKDLILVSVKNEVIGSIAKRNYCSRWSNVQEYGEIEIPDDSNEYPFNLIIPKIKENLFLTAHFPLLKYWKNTMKVQIPPPKEIHLPICSTAGKYDGMVGEEPRLIVVDDIYDHKTEVWPVFNRCLEGERAYPPESKTLKYRLIKTDTNNAYYELISKVRIEVE